MIGRHCLQCSACVCSQKGGSFSTIGRSISLFVRFIFPEANNPNRFKILITDWCFGNLGTRVWNVWQLIKIDVFDSDFREVDAFRKKSSICGVYTYLAISLLPMSRYLHIVQMCIVQLKHAFSKNSIPGDFKSSTTVHHSNVTIADALSQEKRGLQPSSALNFAPQVTSNQATSVMIHHQLHNSSSITSKDRFNQLSTKGRDGQLWLSSSMRTIRSYKSIYFHIRAKVEILRS